MFKPFQHVHRVDADFLHRVATFHDEQGWPAKGGNALAHGQVIRAVEFELRDRIVLECVDAQRHDYDVGAVAVDLVAGLIQCRAPHIPAGACRQRVVEVEAFTGAFAVLIVVTEEERKLGFRVAVDRGEQHVAARVENRLGAVAVVIVDVEDRDLLVALVEERLGGDGSIVEVAITAHQVTGGVVSRRTAQGEGTACTALDLRLGGESDLRSAVGRLPGAGGDRCATVEAVVTELAMQAGRFDLPQRACRPGVRQQVTVGVEFGPAFPRAFEEVEVVAAVDSCDRLQAEILRCLDRAEVLVLYPLQHVVGARRHLEARLELAVDEFAAAMVQVVIV
ncbi:hypothetical protein EMIT0215P_110214 [Pseudomonas serboccidentalis]